MKIILIDSQNWKEFETHIPTAIEKLANIRFNFEGFSEARIITLLQHNLRDLWLVIDRNQLIGCGLTYIENHENGTKSIVIEQFSGKKIKKLVKALALFEKIETNFGIAEIKIIGRFGWSRFLRKFGYSTKQVVLSKKIGV